MHAFLPAPDALCFARVVGAILSHYRILDRLGAGGMGEVYRARDERLQRDVAIKVLPAAAAGDNTARARLLREARAAAALNHPHICTVHEVAEAGGQVFIAMELVEGEPLDRRIPAGGLPPAEVVALGRQVADAVAHAHARGVVHRDLKCANVLVTPAARIKVLDFGLARRQPLESQDPRTTETQGALTETGQLIGTIAYMSPEQLRGQTADTRSDIWSLGVVLHEMASGERPFSGSTGFEIGRAILDHPPRQLPARVPAGLAAVITRCLAKIPDDRYRNGGELLAALESIEAGTAPPSRRRSWRRPAAAAAAAIALTVAAMTSGALRNPFRPAGGTPRVDSIAVLPLENLSRDEDEAYLADGMQEALITELAQLPGLQRVIDRSSTARLRDADLTLTEAAERLGVAAVVTGSVLRVGDEVRVTARLIDAATERHLWADTYERNARDVLAMQHDIVNAIAHAIEARVTPAHAQRQASTRQVDPAVYEAYLRGMYHVSRGTPADRERGIAYLQDAADRDPGSAHAWAGLALGYATIGHGPASPPDAWIRARAAAQRAVTLDPDLAEAHAALADVKLYWDWDWAGADQAFRRANELNPHLAMNHYHYAWYHALAGNLDEAISEHKRAQELDPLTPVHTAYLGTLYGYKGDWDAALAEAKKAIDISPNAPPGWTVLSAAYSHRGMHDEAIAAAERATAINPMWKHTIGMAYAAAGRIEEAKAVLAELESEPPIPFNTWRLTMLNAALGSLDGAFRWAAYEPRHAFVPWICVDPAFAPMWKDERFKALLQRLKLPLR